MTQIISRMYTSRLRTILSATLAMKLVRTIVLYDDISTDGFAFFKSRMMFVFAMLSALRTCSKSH
jgi:hypothetical protein